MYTIYVLYIYVLINYLFLFHKASSMLVDVTEPEPVDDVPEWKGVNMDEIHKGLGIYDCQELPPICPSSSHIVLISVNIKFNK